MKSLGTINACFPFIDTETRNILESIMDEAEGYNDFAEILCDRACTESVPPLTIYFAYVFGYNQNNFNIVDRLLASKKHSVLTKPIVLMVHTQRGEKVEWSQFCKALVDALEASENDWIACHIFISWRTMAERFYSESSTDSRVMSMLELKIESEREFSFFKSALYGIKAWRLFRERSIDEATAMYNKALLFAKKHDHLTQYVVLLAEKAGLVKRSNIDEALSILKLQREVCSEIGHCGGLALNNHHMGHIAMATGEFNLGVYYQERYQSLQKRLGGSDGYIPILLAQLYNMMGDGTSALDLINTRQNVPSKHAPMTFIQEAWAMVNLGRVEDAEATIIEAKELVLKSADEVRLGLTYLVEGLIEKSRQEFTNSFYIFEQALDIFKRYYSTAYYNMTLLQLCNVEIDTFSYQIENGIMNSSGPWMDNLMDYVASKNLPGIEAQSKLLKAKFLFKQAQVSQSKKIVRKVQKASMLSSMLYLKDMIKVMLPELSS